jgi:hypothetical protein
VTVRVPRDELDAAPHGTRPRVGAVIGAEPFVVSEAGRHEGVDALPVERLRSHAEEGRARGVREDDSPGRVDHEHRVCRGLEQPAEQGFANGCGAFHRRIVRGYSERAVRTPKVRDAETLPGRI